MFESCSAFGLPTAFPCGYRCTAGIERDPTMCLDMPRRHQSNAPSLCSREVMWSWTWSERCVVVNILSTVGTENTYTPARLEELFKSSQPSPFVPSRIRSPSFLASDHVLNPFRWFVKRSAVSFFVSSSRFVLCLSTVQVLCNLAGAVLELLRLDEICVPLDVSLST